MFRLRLRLRLRLPPASAAARAEALGRRGEKAAVRALRRLGYRVLARRLRTRGGEVDVVALDGDTLVLVEVKASQGAPADVAASRVGAEKRARLRRAYGTLAGRPGIAGRPRRLDVVTVVFDGRRPRCAVHRGFARL